MHLLGREPQRRKSHDDQAHIAHDAGQAHFGPRNVNTTGDFQRPLSSTSPPPRPAAQS